MQDEENSLLILDLPEEDDPFAGVSLPPPPLPSWPTPSAEEVIVAMVERIVERFDPLQIILFGSRARGAHRPASDVDLLVVFPHLEDRRALRVAIATSLYAMPLPKDIIVTTPEELAAEQEFVGSLLETAVREGKILYDRRDQDPQDAGLAALRTGRSAGRHAHAGDRR
jgi:predicted nucleotidyltransferase